MFTLKNKSAKEMIDESIKHLVDQMDLESPDSDEYHKIAENVKILQEAKAQDKPFISGDAIFGGIMTLGGIALILNFEKLGVVTSKALTLLPKLKL